MSRLPIIPEDEDEGVGNESEEVAEFENEMSDEEEIDEITEQSSSQGLRGREQSLQSFLADHFGEDAPSPDSVDNEPLPIDDSKLPSLGWLGANFKTKSAMIRFLLSKQHSTKDIAKLLDVKYQHVRNVKMTQLKRGPNEDWNLDRRKLTAEIARGATTEGTKK